MLSDDAATARAPCRLTAVNWMFRRDRRQRVIENDRLLAALTSPHNHSYSGPV